LAAQLAMVVHRDGSQMRSEVNRFFERLPAATVDSVVQYGHAQQWIVDKGDRVARGDLEPEMTDLGRDWLYGPPLPLRRQRHDLPTDEVPGRTMTVRLPSTFINMSTNRGFMPRTMRSGGVRAWRMEQLIRDLALGEKPLAELAEIHGLEEQTVRVFKMNHKPEIAAVVADWTSQFDHIWSTKKENRLRVLTQRLEEIEDLIAALYEHARRETETIRDVDPEASEVPVNGPEYRAYVKEQRALIREISEETGQLPTRVGRIEMEAKSPLTDFDTIALDENGQWHGVADR
jgi:hypothetical protein